jgi:hypothetical protein
LHARDRSRDEERPHATALCSARLAASGWYPICHLRPAGCNGAALVTGDAQLFGITGASGPTRALLERGDAGSDRVVPIAVVNG